MEIDFRHEWHLIYGIDYDDTCLHGGHMATQTLLRRAAYDPKAARASLRAG
jgi:hypothetical protein